MLTLNFTLIEAGNVRILISFGTFVSEIGMLKSFSVLLSMLNDMVTSVFELSTNGCGIINSVFNLLLLLNVSFIGFI